MLGGSAKEYYSNIVDQSAGNNRCNKRGCSKVVRLYMIQYQPPDHSVENERRSEEQGNICRKNTDLPTPPTSLVVFFCTVIFNSKERQRTQRGVYR